VDKRKHTEVHVKFLLKLFADNIFCNEINCTVINENYFTSDQLDWMFWLTCMMQLMQSLINTLVRNFSYFCYHGHCVYFAA